jgi:hypothetical protein
MRGNPAPAGRSPTTREGTDVATTMDDHHARTTVADSRTARTAGGFFLAFIVASVLASALGHIGLSDTESLYGSFTSTPGSFRLALVIALVSALLFLLAAWSLYVLLRPISQPLALLFLLLNAVGVAIQCSSLLFLISASLSTGPDSHLQAYSAAQLAALTHLSIGVYKTGFVAAQLFFSTWLFPLGYLVYTSRFLPRILGVLLVLDGFADLFWFFQGLLLPTHPALSYPSWALSFIAEFGLTVWLLVKGVKVIGPPADSAGWPPSKG